MGRVASLWMLLLAGCGPSVGPNGASVGKTCTANNQCDSFCLLNNNHYPGGMCTHRCTTDAQCPEGSACIDDEGGICVVGCRSNGDCAGFGRGFVCDDEERAGALEGKTFVCRVP